MDLTHLDAKLDRISEIMQLQARKDFLLLTMSPDKVRDQLVREFGGETDHFGNEYITSHIVHKAN